MTTIGARVRSLREHKNWSQEDLAKESGLRRPHISLIENNERTPGAGSLIKLADALQTSIDFLVNRTDDPNPRPIPNNPILLDPMLQELIAAWPDLPPIVCKSLVNVARASLQVRAEKCQE